MYLKTTDIINFSVDYIELFWTLKNYREIAKWLDSDNSNYRFYDWFVIEKNEKINKYLYKLSFNKDWIPVFAWYLWDPTLYISTNNYFVVYWWAFNIFSLKEIIIFINNNIEIDWSTMMKIQNHNYKMKKRYKTFKDIKEHLILKRLDLAVDINIDIKNIQKNFNELKWKWCNFFDSKWNTQTFYIWEYKKSLNKCMLIRVYDKIADIIQKEKQIFYTDYLNMDYVTRIEIEFRPELLKFTRLEQLLNEDYMFSIFTNYISKKTHLFEKIKNDKVIKFQRLGKNINIDELKYNQIVKERYINTFLWYAKKFITLWSCPIDVLLQNWIIKKDLTAKDIWNSIKWNKFNLAEYRKIVYKRTKKMFSIKDLFSNQEEND